MQNLSEKRTQWCGNGSKVAHLGPKMPFLGHKRLQTPQMAGKSGSNGGSQWDTCGGSTLSAKLVRKMHPVVRKWPQIYPFGAKNDFFFASNGPPWGPPLFGLYPNGLFTIGLFMIGLSPFGLPMMFGLSLFGLF